jgi:hypothetical protein
VCTFDNNKGLWPSSSIFWFFKFNFGFEALAFGANFQAGPTSGFAQLATWKRSGAGLRLPRVNENSLSGSAP